MIDASQREQAFVLCFHWKMLQRSEKNKCVCPGCINFRSTQKEEGRLGAKGNAACLQCGWEGAVSLALSWQVPWGLQRPKQPPPWPGQRPAPDCNVVEATGLPIASRVGRCSFQPGLFLPAQRLSPHVTQRTLPSSKQRREATPRGVIKKKFTSQSGWCTPVIPAQ